MNLTVNRIIEVVFAGSIGGICEMDVVVVEGRTFVLLLPPQPTLNTRLRGIPIDPSRIIPGPDEIDDYTSALATGTYPDPLRESDAVDLPATLRELYNCVVGEPGARSYGVKC